MLSSGAHFAAILRERYTPAAGRQCFFRTLQLLLAISGFSLFDQEYG